MNKGGRPRIQFDWTEFDKLVSYQVTQQEICDFFDVDWHTMNDALIRERGEGFSEIWQKKKSLGRIRLRKAQLNNVEAAAPGWAAMAIWLDKKMMPEENPDRIIEVNPTQEVAAIGSGKATFVEFCTRAGYPPPFQKQIEMRAFAFEETEPRLCLGSRGYGKTDYMTILGVAYDIYLHGEETSNLIITKTKTRGTAIIEEIASALLSNGVELEKANASCVRIKGMSGKDHSAEVLSIKSSFRGRHPKRILMDDPVTEEDVSDAMRKLVKRKYNEALKLTKNVCIIGQPAHTFDLYAELREIVKKMEVPHGTIFELDHDLAALRAAGVDEHSIEMSYHLRIPKDGSSVFANLKFIDEFPVGTSVAFIDPSDGGDLTAVSIVRAYFDGVAVVGKAWKRAWYHCVDDMLKAFKEFGVARVAFETNKHGNQPIDQLNEMLGPYGIGVVGIHSDSNKHAAIVSAGSYAHMIHLSKQSDKAYTDNVVQYEYGAKIDDPPDSLARCLIWLGLIRGKK